MELSDKEKALIIDMINVCWKAGAVKSPEDSLEIEALRAKVLAKPHPQDSEKK